MTREEAKQWAYLLAAYSEGKRLQVSDLNGWIDAPDSLNFHQPSDHYRIKPEPTLRQLTRPELMEHCRKGDRVVSKGGLHADNLYIQNGNPMLGINKIDPRSLLDGYHWLTGAPCGVME